MSEIDYERIEQIAIDAASQISLDKMKIIAKEAAKEAVNESAQLWGMDVRDPIKIQKNMAYLNFARQNSEDIKKTIFTRVAELGIVGFIVYISTILTFKP